MTDDAKRSLHDLMDVPEVTEKQNSGDKLCCEAKEETCGNGTDVGHSNQLDFSLQAPLLEDQPLTNLIAEFVKIKAGECLQPRDQVAVDTDVGRASEHDDKDWERNSIVSYTQPTSADGQQLDQTTLAADVSSLGDQSLSGLIGQLLKLETGENARNHVTDDATSTHLSEDEASDGSSSVLSSAPSVSEGGSANGFSVKIKDVEPDLGFPGSRKMTSRNKRCQPKAANPRMVELAQQSGPAQWQMHQWHMYQWQVAQAAHMAHWQRASNAFHVQQAIQSRSRHGYSV
jgi:hypothetical protein